MVPVKKQNVETKCCTLFFHNFVKISIGTLEESITVAFSVFAHNPPQFFFPIRQVGLKDCAHSELGQWVDGSFRLDLICVCHFCM